MREPQRHGRHRAPESERLDDSIEAFLFVVLPFGAVIFALVLVGFPIGWILS